MAKETYYFSHDHNARNDRKIAALVKDYKSAGYGIFWATCEMMHEEGGRIEFDELTFGSIAKDLNEDLGLIREVLEKCAEKYKLFSKQIEAVLEANEASRSSTVLLRSSRIDRNLSDRKNTKQNKVKAGQLGGIKSGESRRTKKKHEANRISASSNEAKERKGKEIKDNTIQQQIHENYRSKNAEDMVVIEMMKVWEKLKPGYSVVKEVDYPALLNVAYAIAERKGWKTSSVVTDKEFAVVESWTKIAAFIANGSDKFFKKLTIDGIANPKNFQKVEEAMRAEIPKSTGVDYDQVQNNETLRKLGWQQP